MIHVRYIYIHVVYTCDLHTYIYIYLCAWEPACAIYIYSRSTQQLSLASFRPLKMLAKRRGIVPWIDPSFAYRAMEYPMADHSSFIQTSFGCSDQWSETWEIPETSRWEKGR